MSRNRVVWSEGLFLRPQHFQQMERSVEMLVQARTAGSLAHAWGFSKLVLEEEALKIGRLSIRQASGVLPDGTPFSIPDETPAPPPLEVPTDLKDALVYLALPAWRAGMPEFAVEASTQSVLARYVGVDRQVEDAVLGSQEPADMRVGRLNLRYMAEGDPRDAFCTMGLARIIERRSTGVVALDEAYIPPMLECAADKHLRDYLDEARNLVRHRSEALAGRLNQSKQKGVGEISEFLMLQIGNRFDPWLAHLARRETLHPEALYTVLLQLAGELATFSSRRRRRATDYAAYRHDDLRGSFEPLMADIRDLLTEVINPNAINIPLQERAKGLYTGSIPDLELVRTASFILVVNAQMNSEALRQRMPREIKIGPAEKIRDLVMSHLPGITVQPLPMAPPSLPFYAGYTYFELDRRSEFWKPLEVGKLLALHVAGDFPGIHMELWALRA
jgi:type VI secretion system protein ImpJ